MFQCPKSSLQKVRDGRNRDGFSFLPHLFTTVSSLLLSIQKLIGGCIFKQQSQIKLPLSERINYVNRRRVVCNFYTGFARQGPISNVEVNNDKNLIFFIYFHHSCTRNDDHLILLIKTGMLTVKKCSRKLSLILLKSVRG